MSSTKDVYSFIICLMRQVGSGFAPRLPPMWGNGGKIRRLMETWEGLAWGCQIDSDLSIFFGERLFEKPYHVLGYHDLGRDPKNFVHFILKSHELVHAMQMFRLGMSDGRYRGNFQYAPFASFCRSLNCPVPTPRRMFTLFWFMRNAFFGVSRRFEFYKFPFFQM